MNKIVFSDEISIDKLVKLTANKVQELVEGYNVGKARLDVIAEILYNVVKRVDEITDNEIISVDEIHNEYKGEIR